MSLSNVSKSENQPFRHGKIILGTAVGGPVEVTLASLEGPEKASWDATTTEEYMGRVREKAKAAALEIVNKARAEAEHMHKQAWEQGYAEGQAAAAEEFENIRQSTETALAEALESIQTGAKEIWAQHRRELTALVTAGVEKVVHMELAANSRAVIEKLMDQAVEAVDMRRMLILKVHPDSFEDISDLMRRMKESHPMLGGWKVRACPDMQPGGLIVESDSGLVDNSIEGRLAMLRNVMAHLTLADENVPSAPLRAARPAAPEQADLAGFTDPDLAGFTSEELDLEHGLAETDLLPDLPAQMAEQLLDEDMPEHDANAPQAGRPAQDQIMSAPAAALSPEETRPDLDALLESENLPPDAPGA